MVVNQEGFNLVVDQDQQPIPKKGTEYDFEKLGTELKKIEGRAPGQERHPGRVGGPDQVRDLIETMDIALSASFPDISLVDTGGAGI